VDLGLALDVELQKLAPQVWVGLVVFICRAQFAFHPSDPMVEIETRPTDKKRHKPKPRQPHLLMFPCLVETVLSCGT
jgi:hypothetical protein